MGELYTPYPKLPKNIRQVGDRDLNVKLFLEDYVNTYLKRLYPTGGQYLRVGLLLGESKSQDGIPYLFVDGALEMDSISSNREQVEFTEEAWNKAYQTMDQMFPKRIVLGWFLCSSPEHNLSPLNYWKQHNRYFSGKNQLMYLNCGLEGDEALYVASEDGFYKLRGYNIFYERNQMMQDYMVSRKDIHRVESAANDTVIRDFRQKMLNNKEEAHRHTSTLSILRTTCGVLSITVLACGVAMINNYHKMKEMESVLVSALPEDAIQKWTDSLENDQNLPSDEEMIFEEIPGEVYPTQASIVINAESFPQTNNSQQNTPKNEQQEYQETENNQTEANETQSIQTTTGETISQQTITEQTESGLTETNESETGQAEKTENTEIEGQAETYMAAEPVQIPADAVLYTIQEGETLYGICLKRYHSVNDLEKICQWNQLTDINHLSIGQKIYLPPAN